MERAVTNGSAGIQQFSIRVGDCLAGRQMRDRLAGFRDDHLGDEAAMAGVVVALEAQQASWPLPCQDPCLR